MKFFHVYNEKAFIGLEKNGLINKDSGFKIQHAFSLPREMQFNEFAKKGGKLHSLIKENSIPFYVDRIAGGIAYYKYEFDKKLIKEYDEILGDWFLGFQLHESASNRRNSDWQVIIGRMNGEKGPYDKDELTKACSHSRAVTPYGQRLYSLSQDAPEVYAKMRYAETPEEYFNEMRDLFLRRMAEVDGHILPCDSYYLATKLQNELGMKTFMPEVGCQIPNMRQEVAIARGTAKASNKTWGTYYECWRELREGGKAFYSMPCFNSDLSNEWYLTQELHSDDFTSYGENGGSSRLLQRRIYYYALMAGADYFSEEWGLNCSYSDMKEFTLSDYGMVKKNFINDALSFRGIKAYVPFAIVLPKKYSCIELVDMFEEYEIGKHRSEYLRSPLNDEEKNYYGHIEDVLKLCFAQTEKIGNEGHVITNSRLPDVFDIIYEDADENVFSRYEYLIDASLNGDFAKAKAGTPLKVLESSDLNKLELAIKNAVKETLPCYSDGLCWLVSKDEAGKRYISLFNNEGNERSLTLGNIIHKEADKTVHITFKDNADSINLRTSSDGVEIHKIDSKNYTVCVPATGFAIIEF